jgi:hypothetical protein
MRATPCGESMGVYACLLLDSACVCCVCTRARPCFEASVLLVDVMFSNTSWVLICASVTPVVIAGSTDARQKGIQTQKGCRCGIAKKCCNACLAASCHDRFFGVHNRPVDLNDAVDFGRLYPYHNICSIRNFRHVQPTSRSLRHKHAHMHARIHA